MPIDACSDTYSAGGNNRRTDSPAAASSLFFVMRCSSLTREHVQQTWNALTIILHCTHEQVIIAVPLSDVLLGKEDDSSRPLGRHSFDHPAILPARKEELKKRKDGTILR